MAPQRDPAARHSVEQYLQEAAASAALPAYLADTIHPFFASMLRLDTDARVALVSREYGDVKAQLLTGGGGGALVAELGRRHAEQPAEDAAQAEGGSPALPPPQQAVAGLLSEAQASLKELEGRSGGSSRGSTPMQTPRSGSVGNSHTEQQQAAAASHGAPAAVQAARSVEPPAQQGEAQVEAAAMAAVQQPPPQHEGMVLVAVLLCTLLRGSRLQEHKARVVSLLCDSAAYCDDETRLQRLLPYLVAATAEPLSAVKCVALRAIARVLAQVRCRG